MVGRLFQETGRPRNFFFAGNLRSDRCRHEGFVTDAILECLPDRWVRLWDVDPRFHSDVDMTFGNLTVYGEVETGEVPYERVKRRMRRYARLLRDNELVVWIAIRQSRLDGLMKRARRLSDRALFTVLGSGKWMDLEKREIDMQKLRLVGRTG